MHRPTIPADPCAFLQGSGEASAVARAVDWSKTPLGPPAQWPRSLKTLVAMIFNSRHPMLVWWGPQFVQLYNDAFLPSFGQGKHPAAMGQGGEECWQEVWPIVGTQIEDVMRHGKPSWAADALIPIFRNGRIEEVYWTYGYSPVHDDNSEIAGMLVVCTETTPHVVADRRLAGLQQLADAVAQAADPEDALVRAAGIFGGLANDVPFALVYRWRSETSATLASSSGLDPDALARLQARLAPRLAKLERSLFLESELLEFDAALALPGGPWPEPVTQGCVVPFSGSGMDAASGYVVFGTSPRLPFDAAYRDYLENLADRVAQATGRLRAEQRAQGILESITDGFFSVDRDWRFSYANPQAEKLLGRNPGDLIGSVIWDAYPGLVGSEFERVYRRAAEERIAGSVTSYYPDHERWYEVHAYPAPEGISIYFRDVNERMHAQEALRASEEALRRADQSKDEFLAMLAHELRNPLAPLRNSLHILRLSGAAGGQVRVVEMMERQVNHLVRLVDDLLEVSRITSGKIELRKQPLDAVEVLRNAVETSKPMIEAAGHALHAELPAHSVVLEGDAVRLAQVFSNLLNNAAKYTDRGGQIWLSLRAEAGRAIVTLKDTGIGIEADMLPRIFEMFIQADSPNRQRDGLGIGLSLVKRLVEMHGGTVEAKSEGRGRGSEFVVVLPFSGAQLPTGSEASARSDFRARRVLLVDDNRDAADSLGALLQLLGSEIEVVHNGAAALAAVDACAPAVVLLDIGMPGMDGYEVARALRRRLGKGIKLVALTGFGNEADRRKALEAGFDDHLVKPVEAEVLLALLARLDQRDVPAAG